MTVTGTLLAFVDRTLGIVAGLVLVAVKFVWIDLRKSILNYPWSPRHVHK